MSILFDHWFNEEFEDFKFEQKYIRPCEYSIEERLVNALNYISKKSGYEKFPETLRIKQSRIKELELNLGSRFTLKFAGPLGYTLIKEIEK